MIKKTFSHTAFPQAGVLLIAACAHAPSTLDSTVNDKPSEQTALERGLIGIVSFQGEDAMRPTIEDRMAQLEVRSASVAIYSAGELHWASAYGEAENSDTLFQAAWCCQSNANPSPAAFGVGGTYPAKSWRHSERAAFLINLNVCR